MLQATLTTLAIVAICQLLFSLYCRSVADQHLITSFNHCLSLLIALNRHSSCFALHPKAKRTSILQLVSTLPRLKRDNLFPYIISLWSFLLCLSTAFLHKKRERIVIDCIKLSCKQTAENSLRGNRKDKLFFACLLHSSRV
jgi:hypothetical protein